MRPLFLSAAALILMAGQGIQGLVSGLISDCGCNGEPCVGYKFQDPSSNLNKVTDGLKITATAEDCRQFCKENYLGQAEYFAWINGQVEEKNKYLIGACFCKRNTGDKAGEEAKGVTTFKLCPGMHISLLSAEQISFIRSQS